jgi:hypothetical protein
MFISKEEGHFAATEFTLNQDKNRLWRTRMTAKITKQKNWRAVDINEHLAFRKRARFYRQSPREC